jgi:hypothetical protein
VQLERASDWSIANERMTGSRGKNTWEAPETAAAILLQVDRRVEELCFSTSSCRPYESNARENMLSRSFVKAMSDPVWGGEPQWIREALHIVREMCDRTHADGLPTLSYLVMLELYSDGCPRNGKKKEN